MLVTSADTEGIHSVSLSRDRKTLATAPFTDEKGASEIAITLWDVDSLKEKHRLTFKARTVNAQKLVYNGKLLRLDGSARRLLLSTNASNPASKPSSNREGDDNPAEINAYEIFDTASGQRIFPAGNQIVGGIDGDMSGDGETLVVANGKILEFIGVGRESIKNCKLDDIDILSVELNEHADRVAVTDTNGATWLTDRETCKSTKIIPESDNEESEAETRIRDGLVTRWTWWRDDDSEKKNWYRLRIWSESEQKIVLDRTTREKIYDEQRISVFPAKGDEIKSLIAETMTSPSGPENGFMRIYDMASENALVEFQFDASAESCGSDLVSFLPNPLRLLTVCRVRGQSRLRIWRVVPSTDALLQLAREAVPECPSLDQRRQLGLDDVPPRWCVEMAKPPYNTEDWKQWMAAKDAGRNIPLPTAK